MNTHLFGFLSSDPSLDQFALPLLGTGLTVPPLASHLRHALGVGWVEQGKGVVRRRPGVGHRPNNLTGILLDTPGRAAVGMLHGASDRFEPGSVPPYRARCWVYAGHPVEDVSPEVLRIENESLPQSLASQRQCGTLTEQRFLPLVKALLSVPTRGNRIASEIAMRNAASASLATIAACYRIASIHEEARPPLDVVATDGQVLLVAADKHPFCWARRTGLSDADLLEQDVLDLKRPGQRPDYRAVAVRQGIPCPDGWACLQPGQLLFVTRDLKTDVVDWRPEGD